MVIIQLHTQGLGRDEVKEECESMCQYLYLHAGSDLKITSVYSQLSESINIGGRTGEMELLRGDKRLREKLLGVDFSISPNAFFQVFLLYGYLSNCYAERICRYSQNLELLISHVPYGAKNFYLE